MSQFNLCWCRISALLENAVLLGFVTWQYNFYLEIPSVMPSGSTVTFPTVILHLADRKHMPWRDLGNHWIFLSPLGCICRQAEKLKHLCKKKPRGAAGKWAGQDTHRYNRFFWLCAKFTVLASQSPSHLLPLSLQWFDADRYLPVRWMRPYSSGPRLWLLQRL